MGLLMQIFQPELIVSHQRGGTVRPGVPVAILGDSDSQGYRGTRHGGPYHDVTWNWTDIWDLRRANEVDLGAIDVWGTSYRMARLRALFGLPARAPEKMDYDYNYAESGMGCESLWDEDPATARWLLARMQREPERWNRGLLVIRVGLASIGLPDSLEIWEHTGLDAQARARVDRCIDAIRTVVVRVRKLGPTKIALIGVTRGYNRPKAVERWPEDMQVRRMEEVLGYYDAELQRIAATTEQVVFVDDIDWYRNYFGDRFTGNLRSTFEFGGKVIHRALGDEPENWLLKDEHNGTICNGLWLNHLIAKLNSRFGYSFTPITEAELLQLIEVRGAKQLPTRTLSDRY